ncbi:LysM peptidoglycan-binding domain-containing protein [Allokutzneria sp. NRRL B-24872]|uniref:LysM peptidoglycan-binding domain-containing protein n=1 Tax=Allokutzneria sp. NRRL B-24872 TaxID=1137961 RepID=UPI000A371378|nr:LysM peptidoglycan-binding domain-containing protein [Allokutzneria sp. NRRL B-24872]
MLEAVAGVAEGFIPKPGQAALVCRSLTALGVVPFDLNPEQIVLHRANEVETHGNSSSGSSPPYFKKSDMPTITLSGLIFEGPDTKPKCDRLLNWLTPTGGLLDGLLAGGIPLSVGALAGKLGVGPKIGGLMMRPFQDYSTKLPTLTFIWGMPIVAFTYDVVLRDVNITYTRFSKLGIPLRAKVNLKLVEIKNIFSTLPTNPTSGGPPGRTGHTVTEQETLPGIALEHYGRPGDWRRVAEVNDVEDPMRVRPGDTLYLPNPDELHEEAAS